MCYNRKDASTPSRANNMFYKFVPDADTSLNVVRSVHPEEIFNDSSISVKTCNYYGITDAVFEDAALADS